MTEIKRRIVGALLVEHLDHFQLAAELGEAPFRIRAELQDLRRDRLVTMRLGPTRITWELTARGAHVAMGHQQLTLDPRLRTA